MATVQYGWAGGSIPSYVYGWVLGSESLEPYMYSGSMPLFPHALLRERFVNIMGGGAGGKDANVEK